MKVYSVSYDLKARQKPDYKGLYEELKSSVKWWHYLESTWLIKTNETPKQLFNRLARHMHTADRLHIIEVVRNQSGWLPQKAWKWIEQNVPAPKPEPKPAFLRSRLR